MAYLSPPSPLGRAFGFASRVVGIRELGIERDRLLRVGQGALVDFDRRLRRGAQGDAPEWNERQTGPGGRIRLVQRESLFIRLAGNLPGSPTSQLLPRVDTE